MWFWNSHVYPSNPYQYSVTCMWISGPYLTQGTRSLWKRIPNVTVHKHALLLQQAWGLQEPPESTSDFHESLSLGWYNSNPVCLCCYHVDVFGYQCLGYQLNSTVRPYPQAPTFSLMSGRLSPFCVTGGPWESTQRRLRKTQLFS